MMRCALGWCLVFALVGCGDDDSSVLDAGVDAAPDATVADVGIPEDAPSVDASDMDSGSDGGTDASVAVVAPCPRALRDDSATRHVVIGHPFAAAGVDGTEYEVFGVDAATGNLVVLGIRFDMGTGSDGVIAFTPDGALGFVAQKDGTVGVFTLDDLGDPVVIEAAFSDGFYASGVVFDPAGYLYVLDAQFRESGGGVHRVPIGCDGELGASENLGPARLAYGLQLDGSQQGWLVSKDALDEPLGDDVREVDLTTPEVRSGQDAFVDDDWIGAGFAVNPSGSHAFLGDNAAFGEGGDRVAVVNLAGGGVQGLTIEDPVSIAVSPFEDRVIFVSGFGNAIFEAAFDSAGNGAGSTRASVRSASSIRPINKRRRT